MRVYARSEEACAALAAEIAALIRERSRADQGTVLGLATGSTPVGLYRELIRLHREEGLSFARVTTFNLDEYHGLGRSHPESYWRFMHEQLFDHIDIPAAQIHLPDGMVPPSEVLQGICGDARAGTYPIDFTKNRCMFLIGNMNFSKANEFGARLRAKRKTLGVTQKELAMASGTGLRLIIDLEKGKPTCQIGKAFAVARALGLQVEARDV